MGHRWCHCSNVRSNSMTSMASWLRISAGQHGRLTRLPARPGTPPAGNDHTWLPPARPHTHWTAQIHPNTHPTPFVDIAAAKNACKKTDRQLSYGPAQGPIYLVRWSSVQLMISSAFKPIHTALLLLDNSTCISHPGVQKARGLRGVASLLDSFGNSLRAMDASRAPARCI
ncbi:hypothetical protein VTN02DRAFT_4197 [Thermoascus thermophilus]